MSPVVTLPAAPGSYVLILTLASTQTLPVGRLGNVPFQDGHYLYVGSALGGLRRRVGRHLRGARRLHWHIDYLLLHAVLLEIWYLESPTPLECLWAHALAAQPGLVHWGRRFGSSDCRCPTHLFRSVERPLPSILGDRYQGLVCLPVVDGCGRGARGQEPVWP
ncbi:MAG: GIY-YIG nuclease family protein [Chloroflexi bacterium]|nr:GIY-YIG nuclease family protein [Chloroflexota bacterium]